MPVAYLLVTKGFVLNRRTLRLHAAIGCLVVSLVVCSLQSARSQETKASAEELQLLVPESVATSQEQMRPYVERIEHSPAKIEMLPIPGGSFAMGTDPSEAGRKGDEGPVHEVQVIKKLENLKWPEIQLKCLIIKIQKHAVKFLSLISTEKRF